MPSTINVSDPENVCNEFQPESCCFCNSVHFWKHGHYFRTGFYLLIPLNPPPEEKIQRYLCLSTACGRTFSALPGNILPYCRFFFTDFLLLYEKSLQSDTAWSFLKVCHLAGVSLRAIQRLLSLFKKILLLVQKLSQEVAGESSENLAIMSDFLTKKYTWFGFTTRWYHALYPARLWEIPNPHNL